MKTTLLTSTAVVTCVWCWPAHSSAAWVKLEKISQHYLFATHAIGVSVLLHHSSSCMIEVTDESLATAFGHTMLRDHDGRRIKTGSLADSVANILRRWVVSSFANCQKIKAIAHLEGQWLTTFNNLSIVCATITWIYVHKYMRKFIVQWIPSIWQLDSRPLNTEPGWHANQEGNKKTKALQIRGGGQRHAVMEVEISMTRWKGKNSSTLANENFGE